MTAPELSLIIPTFNERANIAPLMAELDTALEGIDWEALFVDDSTDGTDVLIAQLAVDHQRVRLHHRAENRGGLAGAVVEGMARARGAYVCVMDGDLQHPPSRVCDLLTAAYCSAADVVVASRYASGGGSCGLDGPLRKLYSRALKCLAQSIFPRRLAGVTDPLGGFFLLRRSMVDAGTLRPIGYKILLEILIRCPWRSAIEIPYVFQARQDGTSKANLRQGVRFLRHLMLLAWDCSPALAIPRAARSAFSSPRGGIAARLRETSLWKLAQSLPSCRRTTKKLRLKTRSGSWPESCTNLSATVSRSS